MSKKVLLSALTAALPLSATRLSAQCATDLQPMSNPPGVANGDDIVATHFWDPDGPGPLPESLVIAGRFRYAGRAAANNIAMLDSTTGAFVPLGEGTDNWIYDLATDASGALIAVGNFHTAGGNPSPCVARWDGSSWQPLGGGLSIAAGRIARLANGDLLAAGSFAGLLARWDGSAWTPEPLGVPNVTSVNKIVALPAGGFAVYVFAGAQRLVLADTGSGLQQVGGSLGFVDELLVDTAGDLLIAGSNVLQSWPQHGLARWDGTAWTPVTEVGGSVRAATRMPNGDFVFGGSLFVPGASLSTSFVRWDGTTSQDLQAGPIYGQLRRLHAASDGRIAASGPLSGLGTAQCSGIGIWDGTAWQPPVRRTGPSSPVLQSQLWNGDLVVTGEFYYVDELPARQVAMLVDGQWQQLGAEVSSGVARAMAAADGGDLFLGGSFQSVAGQPAKYMARYDGTQWHALGGDVDDWVQDVVATPSGDAYFGGYFTTVDGQPANHLIYWDGATRQEVGGGLDGPVHALALLPDGDLLVGGDFAQAGGQTIHNLARWDGSQWHAFGDPNGRIRNLHVTPEGHVAIDGWFTSIGNTAATYVAYWDGTAWSAMGNGEVAGVSDFESLPNGDLVATGSFGANSPFANIARWDGTAWTALPHEPDGIGYSLQWLPDGRLALGGLFEFVGNTPTPFFAILETTCPATAEIYGTACTGSAGPVELTLNDGAWLGGTLRTTTTGVPSTSICVAVYGSQQLALPMPNVHPRGVAGCTLVSNDDLLLDFQLASGVATNAVTLPTTAALVGVQLHHQVIPIELDANGHIAALTASNGLRLTIGSF